MIEIYAYTLVNGVKYNFVEINITVKNIEELEKQRKKLENETKTTVLFYYKEKISKNE